MCPCSSSVSDPVPRLTGSFSAHIVSKGLISNMKQGRKLYLWLWNNICAKLLNRLIDIYCRTAELETVFGSLLLHLWCSGLWQKQHQYLTGWDENMWNVGAWKDPVHIHWGVLSPKDTLWELKKNCIFNNSGCFSEEDRVTVILRILA